MRGEDAQRRMGHVAGWPSRIKLQTDSVKKAKRTGITPRSKSRDPLGQLKGYYRTKKGDNGRKDNHWPDALGDA